jgi:hypothetical protein
MLNTGKNAASVFPVAVGEINRTFLPPRILGMVFSCGSVGFGKPFFSTSFLTGFTSKSKTFSEISLKFDDTSDDDVNTRLKIGCKNILGRFANLTCLTKVFVELGSGHVGEFCDGSAKFGFLIKIEGISHISS